MRKTRSFVTVAVAHFLVDAYAAVFWPLAALASMSSERIGTYSLLLILSMSFSQLYFGYRADRSSRKRYVVFGIVAATVCMSLVGRWVDQPSVLLAALILGGLGIASFHPGGVVLASESSPGPWAVPVFIFVGTLGFAAGPLIYVEFEDRWGLSATPWLMVPGLLIAGLAWITIADPERAETRSESSGSVLAGTRSFVSEHGTAILPLYVMAVVRTMVALAFQCFLPKLMLDWGLSKYHAGLSFTVFAASGAVGNLVFGSLSTRMNRRWLQTVSVVVGVPFSVAFLFSNGLPASVSFTILGVASFFLNSTNALHILMGQELSGKHASTISSLMMGACWGTASIAAPLVGWLAQSRPLSEALLVVGVLPLLTLPLVVYLRPWSARKTDSPWKKSDL